MLHRHLLDGSPPSGIGWQPIWAIGTAIPMRLPLLSLEGN